MPGAHLSRLFAMLGALAALLWLAPDARASAMLGQPLGVCVLRDAGGMDPAELLRHPERFDCAAPQHTLGPGDFWVISRDVGRSALEPLNVRFASLWQQGLTLHVLYDDGRILSQGTDERGIAPLIQLGAIAEQELPRRPAKVVRLLWHVDRSANMRGVMLGTRIATAAESRRAGLALAGLYAGFAGLSLALIIYNLALWSALRHRFQLYYCAMATGLLAYAFSSSGAFAWVFPELANNDRLRVNHLLIASAAASSLPFARSFFEPQIFAGWLGRCNTAVTCALFAAALLFFFCAPLDVRLFDTIFTATFLGLAVVVPAMLWRAWRLRSSYLWLFAFGWGIPIVAAMARTLGNFHLVPWSFWLDNATILSMVVEALMSSLAIAYRIRQLRDERDEAIASEVTARHLADTDPLTGLLNRRAFLSQAIGRESDQQLLIADLDHFKRVNDTLGHDGGDEVLRRFARLLRGAAPADALIARLGGEEFAMLVPADAAMEPEKLLDRLRATRMPFDLKVTASIGACIGPLADERDWKSLYRSADIALFEAKSAGRDRARHAHRAHREAA